VSRDGLIGKIKSELCDCAGSELKREIDIQLFNEPYLRDSLLIFADRKFGNLDEVLSFAKVKIIFRLRF
jgi:hypothetical protein